MTEYGKIEMLTERQHSIDREMLLVQIRELKKERDEFERRLGLALEVSHRLAAHLPSRES